MTKNKMKRKPLEGSNSNENVLKLHYENGVFQDYYYYRRFDLEDDDANYEMDKKPKLSPESSCCAFKNDREVILPRRPEESMIGLGDYEFFQNQEVNMFYDSCYCSPCYSPCAPCTNNYCVPRCLSPLPPYIPVPIADCYPKKPKEEARKAEGAEIENLDGEKKSGIIGSIFGKIQSSVSAIKGSVSSMSAMLSKSKIGSKMMGSKTGGGPSSAMGEPMTANKDSRGGEVQKMTSRTDSGFRKSSMGTGGGWNDEEANKSRSHYGSGTGIGEKRSHGWLAGSSSTRVKSDEWGAYMMDKTMLNKPKKVKDAFLKVRFNTYQDQDQDQDQVEATKIKKAIKPLPVKDENSNFIFHKRKSNEDKENNNLWDESLPISPIKSEQKSFKNLNYSQKYGNSIRSKYSQKSKKDNVDEKARLKTIRELIKQQKSSQNHPFDNDYFLESEFSKSFKNSSMNRSDKKNRISFLNSDCSSDDDRGKSKGGLFYRESIKSSGRKDLKPSRNHQKFSNERNESFLAKEDKFSDYFAPFPILTTNQSQRATSTCKKTPPPLNPNKIKEPWVFARRNKDQNQRNNNDETEQIEIKPKPINRMVKPTFQNDYSTSNNLRNIPELLQLHQRISSIESLAPLLKMNNTINYQCSQNINLNIQQNDYEDDDFGELYESQITQAYESQQILKVIKEPKRKNKSDIKYLYGKNKSKSKPQAKKGSSSKNHKKIKHDVHFTENIQKQGQQMDKSKKDTSKSKPSKSFNSKVKSLFYLWKRS